MVDKKWTFFGIPLGKTLGRAMAKGSHRDEFIDELRSSLEELKAATQGNCPMQIVMTLKAQRMKEAAWGMGATMHAQEQQDVANALLGLVDDCRKHPDVAVRLAADRIWFLAIVCHLGSPKAE